MVNKEYTQHRHAYCVFERENLLAGLGLPHHEAPGTGEINMDELLFFSLTHMVIGDSITITTITTITA